jgi:hypothetical protein
VIRLLSIVPGMAFANVTEGTPSLNCRERTSRTQGERNPEEIVFCLFGFRVHACTPAPLAKAGRSKCNPRGVPTLATKWGGRSAAEVCTTKRGRLGKRFVRARGRHPLRDLDN